MNEILLVRSAPLLQFEENLVSITKQFPRSRIHILEHHKSIPELKKRKDKFPDSFKIIEEKVYGISKIFFLTNLD